MRDYTTLLEKLIPVVVSAGQRILDELNRPTGPRGSGGYAEVDGEIESEILDFIDRQEECLDWGIVCEELDHRTRGCKDLDKHYWCIDPHDGTSAFLKGFRGSTVSVGLVAKGKPVLGVVYAPWGPQAQPELYAWCQGLKDPSKYGVKVRTGSESTQLTSQSIIALSQDAEKKSEANALACAPARFMPFPGIAYRLAMVASGVADACNSLNSPHTWDLVGGQALLIGAGLDLYTSNTLPIRYNAQGTIEKRSRFVFGGSEAICRELSQRDWQAVLDAPRSVEQRLKLRYPSPAWRCTEEAFVGRAQGALVGLLVGDALGQLVEFTDPASIQQKYPNGVREMVDGGAWGLMAGQPTDDGEMALHQARALLQGDGPGDLSAMALAYLDWRKTPAFGIGNTTGTAISVIESALESSPDELLKRIAIEGKSGSEANGALMRFAPMAIALSRMDFKRQIQFASREAALTHPNAVPRMVNVVSALLISGLLGGEMPDIETTIHCASEHVDEEEANALMTLFMWITDPYIPSSSLMDQMGWVKHAFLAALWHLQRTDSFEEALVQTIARGGDTDTNAAIVGMFMGAKLGIAAIPERLKWSVLSARPIKEAGNAPRPRPRPCWPTDALLLAEHLAHLARKLGP